MVPPTKSVFKHYKTCHAKYYMGPYVHGPPGNCPAYSCVTKALPNEEVRMNSDAPTI